MAYSAKKRRFKALQCKLETTRKHKKMLEEVLRDPDYYEVDSSRIKDEIQEDVNIIQSLESVRCPSCGKCVFEKDHILTDSI